MKRKLYGLHRVGQEVRHTGSVRGGHARKLGADMRFIYLSIHLIYSVKTSNEKEHIASLVFLKLLILSISVCIFRLHTVNMYLKTIYVE